MMMYLKSSFGVINRMAISAMVLLFFTGCGPRIDSLNPESGPVGSVVTVQGVRFGGTAVENDVKIGDVAVPTSDIAVISTSQLDIKVPAGAVTGQVSVTTGKGTGRSNANFVVETAGGANWTRGMERNRSKGNSRLPCQTIPTLNPACRLIASRQRRAVPGSTER